MRTSVVLRLLVLSDLARRPRRLRLPLPARLRLGGLRLLALAAANRASARSLSAILIACSTSLTKTTCKGAGAAKGAPMAGPSAPPDTMAVAPAEDIIAGAWRAAPTSGPVPPRADTAGVHANGCTTKEGFAAE